jgi:hypothetical protein
MAISAGDAGMAEPEKWGAAVCDGINLAIALAILDSPRTAARANSVTI